MTDLTVPQTLLHPLKAKVVGFHEEAEEYSFQVEYPDPPVCTACGVCGEVVRFGKKEMKLRDLPCKGPGALMLERTATGLRAVKNKYLLASIARAQLENAA